MKGPLGLADIVHHGRARQSRWSGGRWIKSLIALPFGFIVLPGKPVTSWYTYDRPRRGMFRTARGSDEMHIQRGGPVWLSISREQPKAVYCQGSDRIVRTYYIQTKKGRR